MAERDLCPEASQGVLGRLETQRLQVIKKKVSVLYVCPRCLQRSCTYELRQLRGADEPADTFCTCCNPECGKTFFVRS